MTTVRPADLVDASLDVARRFRAFGSYDAKRGVAVRALCRRARGHTPEACGAAFDAAVVLHAACEAVMAKHFGRYLKQDPQQPYDFTPLHAELVSHVGRFGPDTVDAVLGWTLFWYHLK